MSSTGDFYKFVKGLQNAEMSKSQQLEMVLDGRPHKKNERDIYRERSKHIRRLEALLGANKITSGDFLQQITSTENDKTLLNDVFVDAEEAPEVDEAAVPSQVLLCLVCHHTAATMMALPCGHVSKCADCAAPAACIWPGCGADVPMWHVVFGL